jgi:hypothetical protein
MLSRRQLQGFVMPPPHCRGFSLPRRNEEARRSSNHSTVKAPGRLRAARFTQHSSLALLYWFSNSGTRDNAGLQLRRAITIQSEGTKLLEKHAIAQSAARLCYTARHYRGFSLPTPERGSAALFKSFNCKSTRPAPRRALYPALKSRAALLVFKFRHAG